MNGWLQRKRNTQEVVEPDPLTQGCDDLCTMGCIKGILLLVVGLLVFFITREAYQPSTPSEEVSATVLLERVRPVLKLVTVEGDFSELYTHRRGFDWG